GFTTAWLSSGRHVEFEQSWPREVFQQLELLEDLRFREAFVITIGPMFAAETPREQIVAIFRRQVKEMVNVGALDGSSDFAKEVSTVLAELRRNPENHPVIKSSPFNERELAIASTLRLTLGVQRADN